MRGARAVWYDQRDLQGAAGPFDIAGDPAVTNRLGRQQRAFGQVREIQSLVIEDQRIALPGDAQPVIKTLGVKGQVLAWNS